jgi:hypothetical protein
MGLARQEVEYLFDVNVELLEGFVGIQLAPSEDEPL